MTEATPDENLAGEVLGKCSNSLNSGFKSENPLLTSCHNLPDLDTDVILLNTPFSLPNGLDGFPMF